MVKYFKADTAFGAEAECAICYCVWTDPVEVEGCEHIYCRACITGLLMCPQCCAAIKKLNTPNNAIVRMLMRLRGSCSECLWKGTYKEFKELHSKCLASNEVPPDESATRDGEKECAQLIKNSHDYYMEDETSPDCLARFATHEKHKESRRDETMALNAPKSNLHEGDMFGRNANANSGSHGSFSQAEGMLRQEETLLTAHDYGLTETELDSFMKAFKEFDTGHNGKLNWRNACRLLRYYNHPNHPDDVKNLFETAMQLPSTGSVSPHALLHWLVLNRRHPRQWYGVSCKTYEHLLQLAQLLDVDKAGLFTIDQVRLIMEVYFEREVGKEEWSAIVPLLKERYINICQSFQAHDSFASLAPSMPNISLSSLDINCITLPFHDILLVFCKHVDRIMNLKKHNSEMQRTQQLIQRIKRLVGHYDASALPGISKTISNFKGEEESLLMTLVALYGPEPP